MLARFYNGAGFYNQGDFNYDGSVNFNDLLILAKNYGKSTALPDSAEALAIGGSAFANDYQLAVSLVPEPTTLGLLAALPMVLRRRRN